MTQTTMQYTIRPLQKLLQDPAQNYVKRGDLEQLIQKIQRIQVQQVKQGITIPAATEEYLKLLIELTKNLSSKEKLLKTELAYRVDKYIRENELYYYSETHPVKEVATFYSKAAPFNYYDLALYHEHSHRERFGHHTNTTTGKYSVCYARFENRGPQVLIGNLQIDDYADEKYPWGSAHHQKILQQRKNLYLNLVQETVLNALAAGKTKIMFQRGAAALIAQNSDFEDGCHNILMTGKNYDYYREKYEAAMKRFPTAQVGEAAITPHPINGPGIIVERTSDYYRAFHQNWRGDCYDLYDVVSDIGHADPRVATDTFRLGIHEFLEAFYAAEPARLLDSIEALFTMLPIGHRAEDREDKLKYLTERIAWATKNKEKYEYQCSKVVDPFLIKFNYHQKVLAHYPDIKCIRLTPALTRKFQKGPLRFYDVNDQEHLHDFRPEQLIAPQRGKSYIIAAEDLKFPLYKKSRERHGEEGIFTFHEKTLPEVFNQLGLTYKTVKISTTYDDKKKKATAWLLTGGLEELRTTPRPSFATGPNLKVDRETLPRLQTVAKKFGLGPGRLKIINDWLCARRKRLGQYDPMTDEITLSSPSLSLMAHEGLHRLVAKGLVSPREYKSLVAAGRSWAKAHPLAAAQRLPKVKPGRAVPREEYAALFVEQYYERETTARKYLMGAKVPVFARLVGYVKEVRDILGAAAGHHPALARNFLRRIERNQLAEEARRENFPAARRKTNSKHHTWPAPGWEAGICKAPAKLSPANLRE